MKFILLIVLFEFSIYTKDIIFNKLVVNQIDCIANEKKAKELAKTIWLKIYGKRIYDEMPFIVSMHDSIYIVKGSKSGKKKGGVAYIEIRKSDCKILKISHGK